MRAPVASFVLVLLGACGADGKQPAGVTYARLEDGAGSPKTSALDRRASLLEDAKLRGVDYRGTGNEPGWVLEIGSAHLVFATDYGERRFEVPTPTPEVDAEQRTTMYRSKVADGDLTVTIRGETCQDSMADLELPTSIEIRLGDRLYRGCGQALD